MKKIKVRTPKREVFVDITKIIEENVAQDGILHLFVPHTTCGITINEGYDPEVSEDIIRCLSRIVEKDGNFRHKEGNAPSHIKASIIGSSLSIFVEGKKPILGTWQRIFLAEFDGPREREVWMEYKH